MSADSALIDQIVHGVLTQLAGAGAAPEDSGSLTAAARRGGPAFVEICERIVTAELLAERAGGATEVRVGSGAIVTPAGWDYAREHGIEIRRGDAKPPASDGCQSAAVNPSGSRTNSSLLIVVRSTPAVERLYEDLQADWRRELLGCPDDAASLAISAVSRGETKTAVILTQQAHRAACLANRNGAVKAAAVPDAAGVRGVQKQLRANVWCVNPENRTWFELKNLFRAIGSQASPIRAH